MRFTYHGNVVEFVDESGNLVHDIKEVVQPDVLDGRIATRTMNAALGLQGGRRHITRIHRIATRQDGLSTDVLAEVV